MKWTSLLSLLIGAAILVGGRPSAAAPRPKPKEEPTGPITAEQLDSASNTLKQIALAWHNHESVYNWFPSNQLDGKGKPLLSWRVQILPYIEEEALYKQFKLNEPWDSEHNKKLIDKMPKLYAPIRVKADAGMTFYQVFTGKHGLIKPGERLSIVNIPDGTSNTFLAVEAAKPVIWTKPDDLVYDGKEVPALGGLFDGRFHAAFCDGSVRRFKKGADRATLGLMIDPSDGSVIPDYTEALDTDIEKK